MREWEFMLTPSGSATALPHLSETFNGGLVSDANVLLGLPSFNKWFYLDLVCTT